MTLTLPALDQAQAWCRALAPLLEVQHIRPQGKPYLERYFVAGWSPSNRRKVKASAFLHHFVSSDPDNEVHNHPWGWSCSLILVGGYREYRCGQHTATEVKDYRPGDVNILEAQDREAQDRHRIELLERDCWTLFLVGEVTQSWGTIYLTPLT
jgi:hypothetical protein